MRHHRAAAGVALALLAATVGGCLNFAEPRPGPGRFESSLTLADDSVPRARFLARFTPGGDEDGDVRPVADPTVRVLDRSIRPSAGSGAVWLRYDRSFALDERSLERPAVELTGPRLGERPRTVLTLPVLRRAGPASVQLAAGEDLELGLLGTDDLAAAGEIARISWAFSVVDRAASSQLLGIRAEGPIPDTLVVDGDRLSGWSGTESLEASLHVELDAARPADTSGYETSLGVDLHLTWEITRP